MACPRFNDSGGDDEEVAAVVRRVVEAGLVVAAGTLAIGFPVDRLATGFDVELDDAAMEGRLDADVVADGCCDRVTLFAAVLFPSATEAAEGSAESVCDSSSSRVSFGTSAFEDAGIVEDEKDSRLSIAGVPCELSGPAGVPQADKLNAAKAEIIIIKHFLF